MIRCAMNGGISPLAGPSHAAAASRPRPRPASAASHLLDPLLDLFVGEPTLLHPLAHRLDGFRWRPRRLIRRLRCAVGASSPITDTGVPSARPSWPSTISSSPSASPSRTSTVSSSRKPSRTSRRSAMSPILTIDGVAERIEHQRFPGNDHGVVVGIGLEKDRGEHSGPQLALRLHLEGDGEGPGGGVDGRPHPRDSAAKLSPG